MATKQSPYSLEAFQQSRLSPNDRVYLNGARARLTTKAVFTAGGTFGLVWALQKWRRGPKARKWPLALVSSAVITIPFLVLQAREEYRRAIIDLDDESYLRKYLFDAGMLLIHLIDIDSLNTFFRFAFFFYTLTLFFFIFAFYIANLAIVTNPDLNAQQIYSKIAIEEYEQQQRNALADSGQLPYNQPRKQPPPQRW